MAPIPPPPADPSQLANYIPPPPDDPSQLGSDLKRDTSFVGQMFAPSQAPGQGLEINNISGPNWRKDLATNEPVGFGGNMVRSIPSAVLGAVSGFNPAGFAAGEGLRQGAVGINAAMGNTQAPSVLQAVGSPALAYGSAYASNLASPYIGKALTGGTLESAAPSEMTRIPFSQANLPFQQALTQNGPIGGALGAIGQGASNVARYMRENYAGVKAASSRFAEKFPDLVSKYIGSGPEVGDQLAQSAKDAINSTVAQHEAQYPALINSAKTNPNYAGKTFDLASDVGDRINKIAQRYEFTKTGRIAPAEGADFFNSATQPFKELRDASLDEIYRLQKTLNGNAGAVYRSNPPLGAALNAAHDVVRDYVGEKLPEIGKANVAWRTAKSLQESTAKLENANDPLKYITRTMNEVQNTKEKKILTEAMGNINGLGDIVQNIQAYQAAKDLTPVVRSLPQTGMGASIMSGFVEKPVTTGLATSYVTGSPLAGMLGGGFVAAKNAFTSPRLAFRAMQAGQALQPIFGNALGKSIFPFATVAGQAATRGILTNYTAQPITPQSEERHIRNLSNPFK